MIRAESLAEPYLVAFGNGKETGLADTTPEKGGQGAGFRPHELLEAALASCMNISLRMQAEKTGLHLPRTSVEVRLNRTDPSQPVFEYKVSFSPDLPPQERGQLLEALEHCPVRRTLEAGIRFKVD